MSLLIKGQHFKRVLSGILCFMMAITSFIGFGSSETAKAATISSLITPYKPQVVNADANVSYTDANGKTISGIIHHPGILMSQADLDNMRDHVRAGDEPWNTAFNVFSSDSQSSKRPPIYYQPGNDIFINFRGPWSETVNGVYYSNPSEYVGSRANTDSETAFKQAIMWYITGDETYRSNAMTIIRDYSAIQSVVTHYNFRLATMTYMLASAAEILRYSDTPTQSLKWTAADTANLINMMNLCTATYNAHSYFMNQHQFTVMGTMARAIFTNNLQLYAEAVEATTVNSAGNQGGRNGSIKYEMRMMTTNEVTGAPLDPSDYHVQLAEMGRDVGHSYANVAGLSTLAQTIYAQGTKVDPVNGTMSSAANAVNVFNFLDDRLLEGTTYLLKYHLGYDVLWTPEWANQGSTSQYYTTINADGRGRIDSFFSVLYNYYNYIEQRDMTQDKYKYLAYAYETRMPEVAGKDYPLATLLYTPDAAKTVGLSNQKWLSGITGLTATSAGSATINLSWTGVSGALGYNIYRSTDANGTYTKINSAPVAAASYSDMGLNPNTIYYYKVEVAGGSTSTVVSATTGGDGIPALDASSYTITVNETHTTVLKVVNLDGSSQDLAKQASYTSSNPAVATVDAAGVVKGISAGTSTITATYNGKTYSATVRVVVDTSLITWYQFNETSGATAVDSSGFGNNGTINGGSNATWTAGKYGNAINFGGANTDAAYVALPGNIVDNLSSMTISAWVNCSNTADQISLFTAGPAAASSPTKYMMMLLSSSRFTITSNGYGSEQNIAQGNTLAASTWKHIAVTLSGSTGILYIDGVEAARNTGMTVNPSNLAPTNSGNFIGKSEWAGDKYLKGQVDDFRIYNRAIDSSEVTKVMNGQTVATAMPLVPSGLTATTGDNYSVNLAWSAATGATGYNVYASTSPAVNAVYTKVNTDVIPGTTFSHTGLKANTTNYYRVTAVNALGESNASTVSATTSSNMPDASLIAWYKFDETSGTTAVDSSGYGNKGTINGGSNATWTAGKYGNAVNFGGANTDAAYVALPGNIVDNLTNMTFSTWVNTSNTSEYTSLFTAGPSASSSPTKYMMFQPKGSRFTITGTVPAAEQNIATGSNLTANTWKHIAVTLSGSTGILYIDGVEAARNTSMTFKPADLAPTTSGNFIGKSEWAQDKFLKGQVDDFRIYNRALSSAEVARVMNGETAAVGMFDGNQDIGSIGLAGSATYDGSQYTLQGSGADIWGTADAFQFSYIPVTGDQSITAHVNSQTNTNEWAKAGLMIRESLDANAKSVFIGITPIHGVTFQYRSTTGGTTSNVGSGGKVAPYWLKLSRSGNTFTSYISPDGTTWTLLGSTTVSMLNTAYIGLAVSSHDTTKLSTVSFDHVTFNSN